MTDSPPNTLISPTRGTRDPQSVLARGGRAAAPKIDGVQIVELGNVLTRSGCLTEIFRKDWAGIRITPQQVNWVQLNGFAVTDWHRHLRQTDHLIGVGGNIKLALWDGREDSATCGKTEILRLGLLRPVLAIVPPGVWHALRNEGGEPAGYLNVIDELYDYETPDNWRMPADTVDIPDIL